MQIRNQADGIAGGAFFRRMKTEMKEWLRETAPEAEGVTSSKIFLRIA